MAFIKTFSFGAALLGIEVAISPMAQSQKPAPTSASGAAVIEPTAVATPEQRQRPTSAPEMTTVAEAPALLTALPCVSSPGRGFFSRPQVPMPPELQGNVMLVKTGAIRISGKPPSLKPYLVKEMKLSPLRGGATSDIPAWLSALNPDRAFTLKTLRVQQGFSFLLVKEEAPETPIVAVRCLWGLASTTGSHSIGSLGFEMRVPRGNVTLCELSMPRDAEPWRLFLWVGPPSNLIPPEFPSGGGLVRGEVRYEASSTNAIKPNLLGLNPAMITATFFRKEGRTVTAVERLTPGRVLMDCSVPPAEQSLFVAIGASLFIRDGMATTMEH